MATFYVPPDVGEKVMPEVARKKIPEVWLNPGSESDALIRLARSLSVEPIVACSIIGIGENSVRTTMALDTRSLDSRRGAWVLYSKPVLFPV